MAELLSTAEFIALRDIGNKVNTALLQECIDLAEKNELLDLLGNFLWDVIANKDNVGDEWADLLAGSTFTDANSRPYVQAGLKSVLADLSYARYIYRINADFTPFGLVHKESVDSRVTDKDYIKDLMHQARKDADSKFRIVDRFLYENRTIFDRYFEASQDESIGTGRRRWSTLDSLTDTKYFDERKYLNNN